MGRGHGQPRAERCYGARGRAYGEHGGAGAHAPPAVSARRTARRRSRPTPRTRSARTRECSKISAPRSMSRRRSPSASRAGCTVAKSGTNTPRRKTRRVDALADLGLGRSWTALGRAERRRGLHRLEPDLVERGAGRDAQVARLGEPGVHVVVATPGADRAHGLARRVEQRAGGLVAETLAERRRAEPQRLAEPAVAAARAVPADAALEQEDPDARLRIEQVPGRPHPRVAAPDRPPRRPSWAPSSGARGAAPPASSSHQPRKCGNRYAYPDP